MIKENILLKTYTTLGLGGVARYFATCENEGDLVQVFDFATEKKLPLIPIGSGSNMIVGDNLKDSVFVKLENKDLNIIEDLDGVARIKVSAGFVWDEFVDFCVANNFSGVEVLSMIPGTCGASPVQNIGAYGQEVKNVIESVRVFDYRTRTFRVLTNSDCRFSYRDSIFKNELKNKCIIESVIFKLHKISDKSNKVLIPDYPGVSENFVKIEKEFPNDSVLQNIRRAIIKIRSDKLPDPKVIPNVGSFFKNPIIEKDLLYVLVQKFPSLTYFTHGENKYKIPAGFMIEKAGFRGFSFGGVGVYEKNALVLVNKGAISTTEILDLASMIQAKIKNEFGIDLEIEPEIF